MLKKIRLYIRNKFISYTHNVIRSFLLEEHLICGSDKTRLKIAASAVINNALFNVVSGHIIIDDYVFFGHNVCVLTGTHNYYKFNEERQKCIPLDGRDIIIKQGAWIASNVTIIGPCVIGEHSVIGACSLVKNDISPYSIAAGIPAKVIGKITEKIDLCDSIS